MWNYDPGLCRLTYEATCKNNVFYQLYTTTQLGYKGLCKPLLGKADTGPEFQKGVRVLSDEKNPHCHFRTMREEQHDPTEFSGRSCRFITPQHSLLSG